MPWLLSLRAVPLVELPELEEEPPFLATAAAMALRVLVPATPSAVRPFSSWKRLTAVSVLLPKLPVISAQ